LLLAARPTRVNSLPDAANLRADLRARMQHWRALLDGSPAEARQMLRLLVTGRLSMRPAESGYEFSGVGTLEPILRGISPSTTHCAS